MSIGAGTVKLWLLHAFGNAFLLLGIYAWLGIGDADAAQVTGTIIYGISIAFLALWLYDGTFVYYGTMPRGRVRTCYARALRTLLPFALIVVLAIVVYWLLNRLGDRTWNAAATVASWLTLKLRHPVKPLLVNGVFTWILRLVEWVAVPLLVIPIAARVAELGWRGLRRDAYGLVRRRSFAVLCPALLLAALFVPYLLTQWVPNTHGLTMETVSAILRFAAAWVIFVTAWLTLARAAARR